MLSLIDILISSSIFDFEGLSNVILEAMASGLPVVATKVGGNAELVRDGITGTLVPADDPTAIANALQDYATQPELVMHHGHSGRQRVEEVFSISIMMQRYEAVYDSMLMNRFGKRL